MSLSFVTFPLYYNISKNPNGKWKNNNDKLYLLEIKGYNMSVKGQLTILWLEGKR